MENLQHNSTEQRSLKIDVAGLKVDAISKAELLKKISERVKRKEKTFVITPYSEFLYASLLKPQIRKLLNKADFSIADGIGIFWANLFMTQKLSSTNFYLNVVQAWWQVVWTGASILLCPGLLYKQIPEKIVGADFVWDLVELAVRQNFSIYILGGHGQTDRLAAQKFMSRFPNLKIVGTSNKSFNDPSILTDIAEKCPDMLLVGLGPITQEQWIVDNLENLPAHFAIGLGGTFDYVAGAKIAPPKFIRAAGLEWLYRLVTQPKRIGRIFNATWGLILSLVRLKVHSAKAWRPNAIAVVVNSENKILVCKRPPKPYMDGSNPNVILKNYWQFPQGGMEKGETTDEGAQRELMEETGITSVEFVAEAKHKNYYTWNNATRKLFYAKYHEYKGPVQTAMFYKFFGENSEIKLDPEVFAEYAWLVPERALEILADERKPEAKIILAELEQIQVN